MLAELKMAAGECEARNACGAAHQQVRGKAPSFAMRSESIAHAFAISETAVLLLDDPAINVAEG